MNKKFLQLFILSFFIFAIVGTVSAWPDYLTEWEETDHGGANCHAGTYTEAAGTLSATVTPANTTSVILEPGTQFNVTLDITGFTVAANMHVTVGVSARIGDNHGFFFGVHNLTGEFASTIFEVGLDGSGNANNTVTLIVYAPVTGGSHTLILVAVEGGESFGDVHEFNYIKTEITVTVKSTAGGDIPGFNIFFIISIGFITTVLVMIITIRKRKKQRELSTIEEK
ncbi:MAG: hypothetical protein ACFE9X_01130 [Promethearchaeota archaeon]